MRTGLRVRELTAPARGAVSVLEVTGQGALSRVHGLVGGAELVPGALAVRRIEAERGDLLDECLVVVLSEERVELHLHGAPVLSSRVRARLGIPSATEASAIEERAAARLACAPCEAAARVLLDQVEGALRLELGLILAGDEGSAPERLRELAWRGERLRPLLRPPLIVLAGPVNSGKSTLFNALVGHERVVVDAAHGTTRDAVRERVLLGRYAVDLVDTAGERSTPEGRVGEVERAGQVLGRALRANADLVLWLAATPGEEPAGVGARTRVLRSRCDEFPSATDATSPPGIAAGPDPAGARRVVSELVHGVLELPPDPWREGEAVPFEEQDRAAIRDALRCIGQQLSWRRPLESLLVLG